MTTADYILNALFVLVVLRQAQERRIDLRSFLLPLVAVFVVAHAYVHTIPTGAASLAFVGALCALGLTLGLLCGIATQVRLDGDIAFARVGWIAGALLVAGIGSRFVFAFAMRHGAAPAVRDFSIAHHIGAAAWPVALVLMALIEVGARIAVVQVRGRRLVTA
jgi:hypothetical protein